MKTSISNCVRCGGAHENVELKPMTNGGKYTHYSTCPSTGEPILVRSWFPDQARPILDRVFAELGSAMDKFKPFNSQHEGYAVILEKLDELWDAIKERDAPRSALEGEAIQVAAMAVRFVFDMRFYFRENGNGGSDDCAGDGSSEGD